MKRTLIFLHRTFWIGVVSIVIVAILLFMGLRFFAASYITKQRPAIEAWMSNFLGQPLQIENLTLSWKNITPTVEGRNVVILDDAKTHPLVAFGEVGIGINLLDSLLHAKLQLGSISIANAHLTAQQNAAGEVVIDGFKKVIPEQMNANGDNLDAFMGWLLVAPELSLQNIAVDWYDKENKLLPIRNLALNLRNYWRYHVIWGHAALDQSIPTALDFVVKLHGNWAQKQNIRSQIYLNAHQVDLGQWAHTFGKYTLQKGLADFEVWANLRGEEWQSVQSIFTAKQLSVNVAGIPEPLSVAQATANVLWHTDSKQVWKLDAAFENVSYAHWQKIPGFSGLTGSLEMTPQSGTLQLKSHDVIADFGKLFQNKLALTQLQGTTHWEHAANGWQIKASNVQINTVDAQAKANMDLLLPADQSSPVINLLANCSLSGREHLADYLPIGILSHGLVNWLNDAIVKAKTVRSTLILRGPVHNFPFDNHDGVFLVDSHLSDVDLAYWPKWPSLTQVYGELKFAGRQMQMTIDSAQITGITLHNFHAEIPVIEKKVLAMLNVDGSVVGDVADAIKFLQASPLQNSFMGSVKSIQAKGPMQLQLHLAIPLEHTDIKTVVAGKVDLQKSQFSIPTRNLQLTDLTGLLNFTRDGITADRLTARLWDKPITMHISQNNQKTNIAVNYADVTANLTAADNAWLIALHSPQLDGQITIPNNKQQTLTANFQRLYLTSDNDQNFNKIKPTDLPPIQLTADDLRYNGKQYGHLQLQLSPQSGGMQIKTLQATSPTFNLTASGDWLLQNKQQITRLTGDLTSKNVAAMLSSWGYPPAIKAQQGKLSFAVNWQGAAYSPSLDTMMGSLNLIMQRGEITNIGSQSAVKMDIGRLVNLLSIESLTRRLRLDFSDLTARGFSFDTFKGDFSVRNGNAYTQNMFIDGSVAQVGITGRIGLSAKDYDLMISITPQLTSSLPVIVGIATGPIGPLVGAATWVASKIVSPTVNHMATDTYRMTGSWSDPKIKQTGGFLMSPTPAPAGN